MQLKGREQEAEARTAFPQAIQYLLDLFSSISLIP